MIPPAWVMRKDQSPGGVVVGIGEGTSVTGGAQAARPRAARSRSQTKRGMGFSFFNLRLQDDSASRFVLAELDST